MKNLVSTIWDGSEVLEGCKEGLFIRYQGKDITVHFDNNDIREYLKKEINDIEDWTDEDLANEYSKKEEEICKFFIEKQIDGIKKALEI